MAWWSWFWPFGRKEEQPEVIITFGQPVSAKPVPSQQQRNPMRPVSVPYRQHDTSDGNIAITGSVPATSTYTPPAYDSGHSISHSHCDVGHVGGGFDGGSVGGCDGGGGVH
jgi:hypothetical protein